MKKLLSLMLAVVMLLCCSACNNSTNPGNSESVPADTTVDDQQQAATEGYVDTSISPEVKYKKEIVVASHGNVDKVDLQTGSSFPNTTIYLLVYDRLIHYNPTTKEMSPMLAESWNTPDNGLTYTFKLRNDVTFHNGEKFTADDVVFTWERGKLSEEVNVKRYYNAITSCEALNDYEVKMTLATANADFLFSLTFPYMGMLNRKACETNPDNGFMIGTGLWIWEKHETDDYDSFNRNDHYWGESTPTEHLIVRKVPEPSARLIALENGELNVAYNISQTEIGYVRDNPKLDLIQINQVTLEYLNFNTVKEGVAQDINFRLAVAHAIDWDALIQGDKNGYATRATTVWSHAQYGYDPQAGYDYNVDLAKDYLSKSSYHGESLQITGSSGYAKACLIIKDMLNKVGINIEFVEIGSGAFVSDIKKNEWDIVVYQLSFGAFGSDFTRLLGTTNGSYGFANAPSKDKINDLCAKALVATTDEERLNLYSQVQKLMFDDACFIPLFYPQSFTGAEKGISGVLWAANTEFDYRYVKMPEN